MKAITETKKKKKNSIDDEDNHFLLFVIVLIKEIDNSTKMSKWIFHLPSNLFRWFAVHILCVRNNQYTCIYTGNPTDSSVNKFSFILFGSFHSVHEDVNERERASIEYGHGYMFILSPLSSIISKTLTKETKKKLSSSNKQNWTNSFPFSELRIQFHLIHKFILHCYFVCLYFTYKYFRNGKYRTQFFLVAHEIGTISEIQCTIICVVIYALCRLPTLSIE